MVETLAELSAQKKRALKAAADEAQNTLNTAQDCVDWGTFQLAQSKLCFGHGTDNPRDEALLLVLSVLELDFDVPLEALNTLVCEQQKRAILELIVRRIVERKPAPYLTGEAWFAGCKFHVDERVLVPRSPIAEWIERGFSPWISERRVRRILDLGTGSGCMAIAAALVFPKSEVIAVDSSQEALQVTQLNIERYNLNQRVFPLCSDMFSNVTGSFDVILSNPPYVDDQELASMPAEFHHEPLIGLSGGRDGLNFVRTILTHAPSYMNENAILIVEVGASAPALVKAYPMLPFVWLDLERGGENVFVLEASEFSDLHQSQTNPSTKD